MCCIRKTAQNYCKKSTLQKKTAPKNFFLKKMQNSVTKSNYLRHYSEKRHNRGEMTHAEFKKRFLPLHQFLYREAYRMLGDKFEAEDAMQNLYLKLWERREQLGNLVSPEGYCRTVLRNICIDRWRVLRMQEEKNSDFAEDINLESPPDIEGKEAEQCLAHFLSTLSETQQRIMKMNMNGYSFKEIEEITGVSEANIRVTISRLRKRFRKSYII